MSQEPGRIGRYEVMRLLGEGAMGRVYLAMDPLLKRWVAVKVVRDGSNGRGEFLARFQREAELSARLNHPNLITVHDVGEDPSWGPYLAMEYIEGTTLDALLAAGPMAPETAMDLLIQAADALEATHSLGILHRDLKPSNLMVARNGRLRLLDFGIAREQDPNRTATANYLGTPAYSAPELLKSLPATEATDRWSFAVTAFECLVGRQPFASDSLGGTLYLVAQGTPNLPKGMNRALRNLFLKALNPDPDQRPRDLRQFLAELLAVLDLDAEARRGFEVRLGWSAAEPNPKFEGENPTRSWKLGTLAFGSVVIAGGLWWAFGGLRGRALSVETHPPGAQVWINNQLFGTSPIRRRIHLEGALRVRVEKRGYWPMEQSLAPGESALEFTLNPTPFFVDVVSIPPGAEVAVDGEFRGRTPLFRLQVSGPGHRIRLGLPGHTPYEAPLSAENPLENPIRLEDGKGSVR